MANVFIPFRARNLSLLDASIQQPFYSGDSLPILSVFIPSIVVPLFCFVVYPLALSHYAGRMGLPPHPFSFHYVRRTHSAQAEEDDSNLNKGL